MRQRPKARSTVAAAEPTAAVATPIAAAALAAAAVASTFATTVAAAVFRWGNRGRPKRAAREMRVAAKEAGTARKADKASIFKSMARISETFTQKHEQASMEAREMHRRRRRTLREACGWLRVGSGWLVNWATYFVCCAFTIITCQVKGRVWTQGWMLSVLSANGMTWGLVEPLECLIVVSLPFLFDNKAVAWFRTKMKDLGFY